MGKWSDLIWLRSQRITGISVFFPVSCKILLQLRPEPMYAHTQRSRAANTRDTNLMSCIKLRSRHSAQLPPEAPVRIGRCLRECAGLCCSIAASLLLPLLLYVMHHDNNNHDNSYSICIYMYAYVYTSTYHIYIYIYTHTYHAHMSLINAAKIIMRISVNC